MRLEQFLDGKAVPLMRLVDCTEHIIQFSDHVMDFGRCLDHPLDGDVHAEEEYYRNMRGGLFAEYAFWVWI